VVTLSPTAYVRQRAAELRRGGAEVYDLSAGELDMATPPHIVAAAIEAAGRPESHHYGPTAGNDGLRSAVAGRLARRSGQELDASCVVITHGAKQALFNTLSALAGPGDDVLIPAPYWGTFPSSVALAGARPVVVQPAPGTLKVTPETLDAAVSPATRAIILCSPGNPSGLVYGERELHDLLSWLESRQIWVIADETYVDLCFRPVPSPARILPAVSERLVVVGSVSKSFAMTGWRVGWLAGPASIVKAAIAVQSHTTSNVSQIAQAAALAALTGPDVTAGFRSVLQGRLALCESVLQPLGLLPESPDGAFYLFPDVSRFSPDDGHVADRLLDVGVVTVPGSAFGVRGRLRLSFAVADEQLSTGLQRMALLFTRWRTQ
jgi:aspartate aminotransferase